MVLVCLIILICTYQKCYIGLIITNWLNNMFATMDTKNDATMRIQNSKGTHDEIKMIETM